MEEIASVQSGQPAFRFYHLRGVHSPWLLDEDLKIRRLPKNRGGYKRQAVATIKIVSRFLQKLKNLGVYDQSLIIVSADHGWGEIGIHNPAIGRPVSDDFFDDDIFLSRALPLLMIKPVAAQGPLQSSDASVTVGARRRGSRHTLSTHLKVSPRTNRVLCISEK